MKIQHVRLLHELLFCAVVGSLTSGFLWLVTGSVPGPLSTLLFGWTVSNRLHALMERRESSEVQKLKALHELPAPNDDH